MDPGPDVALVSLGTTPGLRQADEAFVRIAREAGLSCELVPVHVGRSGSLRRQSTVTDYVEARAARAAGAGLRARVVVYSTVTAALLQRPTGPYAVRFDSPAALNRPGIAGAWQRRRERKVLAGATLLLPWGAAAAKSIPDAHDVPVIPLRVPIPVHGGPARAADRDVDALAYAGYPEKRGLDILVQAWKPAGEAGRRLLVLGIERERALAWLRKRKLAEPANVDWGGLLTPPEFRSTLARARVFVNASRREDHGLSQLEALAAGMALVTVPSEGPYEALPLALRLDRRLVAATADPDALATAISAGFDVDLDDYASRAQELLEPYRAESIAQVFADQVVPALGLR